MVGTKDHLRNRANAKDRPTYKANLRELPLVKADSMAKDRCKEGEQHSHVFLPWDTYGCCTRCGDEVLV